MISGDDSDQRSIKKLFDEHQEALLGLEMKQQRIIDQTKAEELKADLLDS